MRWPEQGRPSEEKPGPRTPWQSGVLGTGDKRDGNAELPRRREPASYGHDEREAYGGSGKPNRIKADGPGACPDGRDGMRLFGEAPAPPGAIEPREKRWRRRLPVASAEGSVLGQSTKWRRCRTSSRFRRHRTTSSCS